MNKLAMFTAFAICGGLLSACGNVGGGNSSPAPSPTVTTTGLPGNITPTQCNQQATQPQPQFHGHHRCENQNVRPYNWETGSGDVADGCQSGQIAACDSICGMVCLETSSLPQDYQIAWYNWSWQGQSSYSFSGYSSESVYESDRVNDLRGRKDHRDQPVTQNPDGQVAQTCSISSPSCAVGTCRPIGQDDLGICSR